MHYQELYIYLYKIIGITELKNGPDNKHVLKQKLERDILQDKLKEKRTGTVRTPRAYYSIPVKTEHLYNICTILASVKDVGPTL